MNRMLNQKRLTNTLIAVGFSLVLMPISGADDLNLLLITVDTLRADRLGCYGYDRPTSPTVDRLAEEGVLFEKVMAPRGQTWPSLMTIHSSLYPVTHGVRKNGINAPNSVVMLAEILSARGYVDAVYTANPNTAPAKWQGFDTKRGGTDRKVANWGMDWLKKNAEKRFFLWLHFYLPHKPFKPAAKYAKMFVDPDYVGEVNGNLKWVYQSESGDIDLSPDEQKHINDLYDGCVRQDDSLIKEVLDTLEQLGKTDDTLIVFTSDHGETLYDRQKYLTHGASIHETVLHVPLIFKLPGLVPKGERRGTLAELLDVAPTILELMDVPAPQSFQGTSLVPAIHGEAMDLGPAFSELEDRILAVRTETHRFVVNPLGHAHKTITDRVRRKYKLKQYKKYVIEKEELFNTEEDRRELVNLVNDEPELAKELRDLVVQWQKDFGWTFHGAEEAEIDPELREMLESMGYVTQ